MVKVAFRIGKGEKKQMKSRLLLFPYSLQRTNIKLFCLYSNIMIEIWTIKRLVILQQKSPFWGSFSEKILIKIALTLPVISWSHHTLHIWYLGTQLKLQHIFWRTEKHLLLYLLELCFKFRIISYNCDLYTFAISICWSYWMQMTKIPTGCRM